jgi:hypothetical protein
MASDTAEKTGSGFKRWTANAAKRTLHTAIYMYHQGVRLDGKIGAGVMSTLSWLKHRRQRTYYVTAEKAAKKGAQISKTMKRKNIAQLVITESDDTRDAVIRDLKTDKPVSFRGGRGVMAVDCQFGEISIKTHNHAIFDSSNAHNLLLEEALRVETDHSHFSDIILGEVEFASFKNSSVFDIKGGEILEHFDGVNCRFGNGLKIEDRQNLVLSQSMDENGHVVAFNRSTLSFLTEHRRYPIDPYMVLPEKQEKKKTLREKGEQVLETMVYAFSRLSTNIDDGREGLKNRSPGAAEAHCRSIAKAANVHLNEHPDILLVVRENFLENISDDYTGGIAPKDAQILQAQRWQFFNAVAQQIFPDINFEQYDRSHTRFKPAV